MVKPILTIGVPSKYNLGQVEEIKRDVSKIVKDDYYVLVYPFSKEDIDFKVFYEKDFNIKTFEEIKEFIKKKMEVS